MALRRLPSPGAKDRWRGARWGQQCHQARPKHLKKVLADPNFRTQQAEKVAILRARAQETRRVVDLPEYADCWDVYPFNAGYFMCLRIKGVDAEAVRVKLLEEHGVGTISLGTTDLRVAFSCVEQGDLADLFDRVAQVVRQLQ